MNSLSFEILPSPDSNDHQVRIIIDAKDWLGGNTLGIDPPEFFAQKALKSDGELLIGRCACGCIGCDDTIAQVTRQESEISWTVLNKIFSFAPRDYDNLITITVNDYSWEDTNRTAERLVSEVLKGTSIDDQYWFDWASSRIMPGIITLSFSWEGRQKTFEFGWDGVTPNTALAGARRFRNERIGQSTATTVDSSSGR